MLYSEEKKLDKFEVRSFDGIFFGYASHSIAYRVLNLETNQIVETCEVTFDETQPRSKMVDVSVTVSGSFEHLQINTCVRLQSVSFGVSLLQTNTNTCIQTSNVVIISKKREEGISDSEHRKCEEVPKTVNGETVASRWLRAELHW
jgi:hypothetical protein